MMFAPMVNDKKVEHNAKAQSGQCRTRLFIRTYRDRRENGIVKS